MKTFILLLLSTPLFAMDPMAYRDPKVDYTWYERRYQEEMKDFASAGAVARLYTGRNLASAPEWSSSKMSAGFSKIRNTNYLPSPNRPAFARRIPWLYPNDGCFARVQLANSLLKSSGYGSPKSILAIGNLRVVTPNAPRGRVSWWYHVSSIIEVDGKHYVLDPALSAAPMSLYAWLDKMGTPTKIKIAICGGGASSPFSSCTRTNPYRPSSKSRYLNLEWNQLIRMGRSPSKVLSNPW